MAAVIKDVVVLLPGLLGSVLEREGKELWGLSGSAIFRALFSGVGSVKSLTLQSDSGGELADDGVVATKVLPDTHLIPGLWKVDGYGRVAETLVSRLGLIPGANFFEFPYDWRRDLRITSKRLAEQSARWLHAWRASNGGAEDARLILVGHSMGGLVARYFLECLEGWRDTRALITFGTPHRGSLLALQALALGFRKDLGPVNLFDLTGMVRSLPSAYQLLPIYPCVQLPDGRTVRPGEAQGLGQLDAARAAQGLAFQREIQSALDANLQRSEYLERGYRTHPVVGIFQPTLQGARLSASGVLEMLTGEPDGTDHAGDGTVPRVSAMPLEERAHVHAMYSPTAHASLQNAYEVLAHVEGILTGQNLSLDKYREDTLRASTCGLSLSLEDAFAHDEPITLRVRPSAEPVSLQAYVAHVKTGETVSVRLVRGPDGVHQGTLAPLPPGLYRASVKGGADVIPVTDVFAVFHRAGQLPVDEGDEEPRMFQGGAAPSTPEGIRAQPPGSSPRLPGSAPGSAPGVEPPMPPVVREDFVVRDGERTLVRHPSVEPANPARPGGLLSLIVDLTLAGAGVVTESPGVELADLAADWQELPITVRLSCSEMTFFPGADTDTVRVRRHDPSIPARVMGTVNPGASGVLTVVAVFEYEGHFCGSTRRRIPIEKEPSVQPRDHRGEEADPQAGQHINPVPVPVPEGQTIMRYPSVEPVIPARPGQRLPLTVDLALAEVGAETESAGVQLSGLAPGWKELPIKVRLLCSEMTFGPGKDTGVVLVRRDEESIATTITGTVNPGAAGALTVVATFEYEGRFCGAARRLIPIESSGAGSPPPSASGGTPVAGAGGLSARGPVADEGMGTFAIEVGAQRPHLTVQIHRLDPNNPRRLYWMLQVAVPCEGLPARLSGDLDLGSDPAAFFQSVASTARELRSGEHYAWFFGLGKLLYQRTPQAFRETFRALRQQYGPGFPIQFITDDPHVPWELMMPADVPGAELLCMEHPVARWLLDYQTSLTARLTHGDILTIAPDYQFHPHLPPLPQAQDESRQLVRRFHAVRVPGRRQPLLSLLAGTYGRPVGLLHFAGHGKYSASNEVAPSRVFLEDGDLKTLEVRNSMTMLGQRSRPLVIFNACEVGVATELLGGIGGWAETFVSERFAGFIAPLWPVQDSHARTAVERLVADLWENHQSVGEALRRLRRDEAKTSPTYLSYVYVGDVMARFGPAASVQPAMA